MKTLLLTASLFASASTAFAREKNYQFVFEKEMPLAECEAEMQKVAQDWEMTLEKWQENDYYLMSQGDYAGNAYYSSGSCYIYIN